MTLLLLAALGLACVAANARKRSFRMHLLLVTHGLLLGPAFSGILLLLLWPTVFIALGCACSFLHVSITCSLRCIERLLVRQQFGNSSAYLCFNGSATLQLQVRPYRALKGPLRAV